MCVSCRNIDYRLVKRCSSDFPWLRCQHQRKISRIQAAAKQLERFKEREKKADVFVNSLTLLKIANVRFVPQADLTPRISGQQNAQLFADPTECVCYVFVSLNSWNPHTYY